MQFRDLGAQYRALKADIDQGIQSVIESYSRCSCYRVRK